MEIPRVWCGVMDNEFNTTVGRSVKRTELSSGSENNRVGKIEPMRRLRPITELRKARHRRRTALLMVHTSNRVLYFVFSFFFKMWLPVSLTANLHTTRDCTKQQMGWKRSDWKLLSLPAKSIVFGVFFFFSPLVWVVHFWDVSRACQSNWSGHSCSQERSHKEAKKQIDQILMEDRNRPRLEAEAQSIELRLWLVWQNVKSAANQF